MIYSSDDSNPHPKQKPVSFLRNDNQKIDHEEHKRNNNL